MFSLTILRKFSSSGNQLIQDGSTVVGLPANCAAFPKTSCGFASLLNSTTDSNWASVNAIVVDPLGYIYTTASTVAQVITLANA